MIRGSTCDDMHSNMCVYKATVCLSPAQHRDVPEEKKRRRFDEWKVSTRLFYYYSSGGGLPGYIVFCVTRRFEAARQTTGSSMTIPYDTTIWLYASECRECDGPPHTCTRDDYIKKNIFL